MYVSRYVFIYNFVDLFGIVLEGVSSLGDVIGAGESPSYAPF